MDDGVLWRLLHRLDYEPADFYEELGFRRLSRKLDELGRDLWEAHPVYHCATPPAAFSTIVRQLEVAGMARGSEPGQRRIIIEKPFGTSLASARELNALVSRVFGEESVYRIAHYLGKETVQNIVAFRFANSIFRAAVE